MGSITSQRQPIENAERAELRRALRRVLNYPPSTAEAVATQARLDEVRNLCELANRAEPRVALAAGVLAVRRRLQHADASEQAAEDARRVAIGPQVANAGVRSRGVRGGSGPRVSRYPFPELTAQDSRLAGYGRGVGSF